jgi:hypothetical protein
MKQTQLSQFDFGTDLNNDERKPLCLSVSLSLSLSHVFIEGGNNFNPLALDMNQQVRMAWFWDGRAGACDSVVVV